MEEVFGAHSLIHIVRNFYRAMADRKTARELWQMLQSGAITKTEYKELLFENGILIKADHGKKGQKF